MNAKVIVVMGAGSIGQAIARRVSTGKHDFLMDGGVTAACRRNCPSI